MRSHPPRVVPGPRRYPVADTDDPATVADHEAVNVADDEAVTGDDLLAGDDPATVADDAAPVASDHATDEAATGGRSRGRSSAA